MSGVYNSKYTGEQIDGLLGEVETNMDDLLAKAHAKEVQNISDISTIYIAYKPRNDDERKRLLPTLTAADNGKRYLAQLEPDKPYKLGVYHWMNDSQKWEYLFQLTGSTIYLDHTTRLAYQYRSSAPYLRPLAAVTQLAATANGNHTYFKIYDLGNWMTLPNDLRSNFSILISSRAGELILVSIASHDSNALLGNAIRLTNEYSKVAELYLSINDKAIYVKASGWANNIAAHILSSSSNMYMPTISSVTGIPEDATKIEITEMGPSVIWDPNGKNHTDYMRVGNVNHELNLLGPSNKKPMYNESPLALESDIPAAVDTSKFALKADIPTVPSMEPEEWTFTVEGSSSTIKKKVYVAKE